MDLAVYFENVKGTGILATSDSQGNVDAAVYNKPYVLDEQTIAFSMLRRMTYLNIQSNPKACFVFLEKGEGCHGFRLYLTKQKEETDPVKIKEVKKRHNLMDLNPDEDKHLVYFEVNGVRPLIGGDTQGDAHD
jgi:hypothetical protein